jgi:hypothetical protein
VLQMEAVGHTAVGDLLQLYPEHLAIQWAGCGVLLSFAKYRVDQREHMRQLVRALPCTTAGGSI